MMIPSWRFLAVLLVVSVAVVAAEFVLAVVGSRYPQHTWWIWDAAMVAVVVAYGVWAVRFTRREMRTWRP